VDLIAAADVDQAQRPREVHGRAEIHPEAGCPERPPEPDRLRQQATPVDELARGRQEQRGLGHVHRLADAAIRA